MLVWNGVVPELLFWTSISELASAASTSLKGVVLDLLACCGDGAPGSARMSLGAACDVPALMGIPCRSGAASHVRQAVNMWPERLVSESVCCLQKFLL